MILAFKEQFKFPIQEGIKIHTIREDSHFRWKSGNTIQMATGVRTPQYHCFYETTCKSVQALQINWIQVGTVTKQMQVKIDGVILNPIEVAILAAQDGFKNVEDFAKWFDKDFSGKIIHWTDYRYE